MNERQLQAFLVLPRVTGAMSMVGSFWICYEVLRKAENRGNIQQRILLGMGITDFITSFTYVVGIAPFAVEDGGIGNELTCDLQGFFGQFVPSTAIYNACLSIYYLGTIKYGWKKDKLRRLEIGCHTSALLFPIITGAICWAWDLFNPAFIHCWIADYPKGCTHDPDVECTRGDGELAVLLGWLFYYVPVWICGFGIATVAMGMVYMHVRNTELASKKYAISHAVESKRFSGGAEAIEAVRDEKEQRLEQKKKEMDLKLSQRVAWQGIWYLGAFYLTWFFPTLTTVFESFGVYKYWILVALAFTLPLQGFLNWAVYIRPRYLKYKEKHAEWSHLYAFYRALTKPCSEKKGDDDDNFATTRFAVTDNSNRPTSSYNQRQSSAMASSVVPDYESQAEQAIANGNNSNEQGSPKAVPRSTNDIIHSLE